MTVHFKGIKFSISEQLWELPAWPGQRWLLVFCKVKLLDGHKGEDGGKLSFKCFSNKGCDILS